MRDTRSNWAERAERLGYGLHRNVTDSMKRKRKFMTTPLNGSGTVGYFDSLAEMATYIRQVEAMRCIDNICKAIDYGARSSLPSLLVTATLPSPRSPMNAN